MTEYRKPFTVNGFGNWFRERVQSIFGWLTLKEAERYTREAQRKRMAVAGMELLVRQQKKSRVK